MASLPSLLFPFFLLFLLSPSSSSSSPPDTINLTLTPFTKSTHHRNPWQRLNHHASASLARANHLKHPNNINNSSITKTPLFPRSYGGYSISLGFGKPSQILSFVMDTGSSLVWFPCTKRYLCSNCNFPNINPTNISIYIPKLSSSVKVLGCKNPKCGWIFRGDTKSRCKGRCDKSSGYCTEPCPSYLIQYGSGATAGILLSETLNFPSTIVEDFVIGCSILSIGQPAGIAGFGRGPESLPSQMGLKKFSYCLVSHRFDDDASASSEMALVGGADPGERAGISYTPFRKISPSLNPAFQDYYYVTLRKITVGGKKVKVPYSILVADSDGNGGTIVDSGTTFTFLEKDAFELVSQEFEKQMANYSRAVDIEKQSGLRPCYDVSGEKTVYFPNLVFHFKGGGKMELPLADYFSFVNSGVVCMTIISNKVSSTPGAKSGPSIIIGNYQQQNFYLEYDLEKGRLGFRKQICK